KLHAYLDKHDEKLIDDLYTGKVKQNEATLAGLEAEQQEYQEAINKWIQHSNYPMILESWVKGLTLDWEALYKPLSSEQKPRRISAPTYPFAKERHWIASREETLKINQSKASVDLQP